MKKNPTAEQNSTGCLCTRLISVILQTRREKDEIKDRGFCLSDFLDIFHWWNSASALRTRTDPPSRLHNSECERSQDISRRLLHYDINNDNDDFIVGAKQINE